MGKVYKTNAKYLIKTHRPPAIMEHEEGQKTKIGRNPGTNNQQKTIHKWSPINMQFFIDDDSDEEDTIKANKKQHVTLDHDTFQYEENQLRWDHSPEQYQLINQDTTDDELQVLLRPQPIFQTNSDNSESSSHDEVFMERSPTRCKNTKLKRQNAIRIKKNMTEPRITRSSWKRINNNFNRNSRSQTNTPNRDNLQRCQNLENKIPLRKPLVPEAVHMDQVQDLEYVLPIEETPDNSRRGTLRRRPKVDYLKLHLGEG